MAGRADETGTARAAGGDGDTLAAVPLRWVAIVGVELLAVAAYFALTSATVTSVRYVLYPFVWINAGLWGVWQTDAPDGSMRDKGVAGIVAVGYLLLLFVVTGLLGFTSGDAVTGLRVSLASPGWGPLVSYLGPHVHVTLVPYRVVGYAALAYLVYAALLGPIRAALSGAVGLVSCISCSFSAILALVAGVTGGSTAAVSAVYGVAIDVSTAVFLVAVGLLVWTQRRNRT